MQEDESDVHHMVYCYMSHNGLLLADRNGKYSLVDELVSIL